MNINLLDYGGEFCARRTDPAIAQLKSLIEDCVKKNEPLYIHTIGVKLITPSFIDELIPPLNIILGDETISRLVHFVPPLEGFTAEQIERGTRIRRNAAK